MSGRYPIDWDKVAKELKEKWNWCCERCGHKHDPKAGYCLTVHHLDGNKSNTAEWNLAALCQRCHLAIQGRIKMDQTFFEEFIPVSKWFESHYRGYLKSLEKSEVK